MPRSVQEIAHELREAVTVMATTNAEVAAAVTGSTPEGTPQVEVRLNNGRIVELGALADELLAASAD